MKRASIYALFGIVLAHSSAPAGTIGFPEGEGLLIDHQPYNFCGSASDTMAFEFPGSPTVYQYVADDFSLPAAATLRRIVYHGFYNSGLVPQGDETFGIRLHLPRPSDGLPGDIFYQTTVLNPPREWTGRNVIDFGGGPELRFSVDLATPVDIPAGQLLWLSIFQIDHPESSFRWECSQIPPPANGHAYNNAVFPNWTHTTSITSNTAFALYSIPEPNVLQLLIIGALVPMRHRQRR